MSDARDDLIRLAHEVFLPATLSSDVTPRIRDLVDRGCRSVLLGESRREYLNRRMSRERMQRESADVVREFAHEFASQVDGPVIIAVDQELGGIQRLAHLVTPLPTSEEAVELPLWELADRARLIALDLIGLGVTLALGPIVDVVRGSNPWLSSRSISPDAKVTARVGAAVIAGFQAAGLATTAKHFPGHAALADDPAAAIATLDTTAEELNEVDLRPFRVAIACGVRAIMLGPAVVMAIDSARPASRSPQVVRLLREHLAFRGAIVTDDLDARSITADGDVGSAAVDALAAGADLLLVGEEHASECALAVADAAAAGSLEVGRLRDAVSRVRGVARPSGLQREVLRTHD